MPPAMAAGAARSARASAASDADAPSAAPTPEEAVLHTNLALLGVPDAEGAKGVALGRGLFRKPNNKALELILFHAYGAIRGRANAKKVRAPPMQGGPECWQAVLNLREGEALVGWAMCRPLRRAALHCRPGLPPQ
jgi:hypothetical protein